jgi:hypothetical protein
MVDLRLHFNRISGSIPDEHFGLSKLTRWDLYNMNLTGTLSTKIGQLRSLQTFRMRLNRISGTIPTEMGNLGALQEVWLHQNDMTGTLPLELCSLQGPEGIVILKADCGPTNRLGDPLVICSLNCCTECCDSVTGYCDSKGNEEPTGH